MSKHTPNDRRHQHQDEERRSRSERPRRKAGCRRKKRRAENAGKSKSEDSMEGKAPPRMKDERRWVWGTRGYNGSLRATYECYSPMTSCVTATAAASSPRLQQGDQSNNHRANYSHALSRLLSMRSVGQRCHIGRHGAQDDLRAAGRHRESGGSGSGADARDCCLDSRVGGRRAGSCGSRRGCGASGSRGALCLGLSGGCGVRFNWSGGRA
ncbi:hypothetical protein FPV67DRAFT_830226 [Lyophyllum atratum]|nr:hypothetical protein FPV67DRAFT_830226 [Lyophyllum atratum]